jgi:deazaflavin-dependent oxidoreductase (nitroreductase family)
MDHDLADWGKVAILETRGRRSGRPRRVAVGFIEEADGTLLVAASETMTDWALNLMLEPRCLVEREGSVAEYLATALEAVEQHHAVTALILKYGTPAERLGSGPAFRLAPSGPSPAAQGGA